MSECKFVHLSVVFLEAKGGRLVSWSWSYRWVLGTALEVSAIATRFFTLESSLQPLIVEFYSWCSRAER